MIPRFQRIVIYGVGLLGGSLGMAMRARGMAAQVVGLGRSRERLEKARTLGAVDVITANAEDALRGADALIVCMPPQQIREQWGELAAYLEPRTFVTDVGSVKRKIVEEAERTLPRHVRFIGSHPMAGSEKTGVEHGRHDFYERSACLLTPTDNTARESVELAKNFWEALGARVIVLSPEKHDELLAGISHLPHIAAAALMQTLARREPDIKQMSRVAGQGLRDTTRIAGSDPEIWRQIFSENSELLSVWLDDYIALLQQWRGALTDPGRDTNLLGRMFEEARAARHCLDKRNDDE